jgi:pentose-5-phosphate-3-epimerase
MDIQLDGGVSEHSEKYIQNTCVDSVVIGSAVFGDGNPTENIEYYTKLFS